MTIASHRKHKKFWHYQIQRYVPYQCDRKYKGYSLKVAEEDLNDLDDGEFYYHEIIGLEVYEGENLIGIIKEILQPGANDVWVVKRKGKRDLLCHTFRQ